MDFNVIREVLYVALYYFFRVIYILITARVLLSWIPGAFQTKLGQFLISLTEPLLAPVRNMIKKSPIGRSNMMLDFSPVVVFMLLNFVERILLMLLYPKM